MRIKSGLIIELSKFSQDIVMWVSIDTCPLMITKALNKIYMRHSSCLIYSFSDVTQSLHARIIKGRRKNC